MFTPFHINAHVKLGKLYAQMGDNESAINEYAIAAIQHTHNGSLVKAIAVNKMIIDLDPGRKDALARMGYLYFQRGAVPGFLPQEPPPVSVSEAERVERTESLAQRIDEFQQDLEHVPLFKYFDVAELQKIAEFLSLVNVKKGTMIIKEGDSGDCMYLIKSGEVGVYTTLMIKEEESDLPETDQEQLHLATLKANDFFGEQALVTDEPRTASVVALTDVQLLRFSKPDLEAIVKSYPRVGTLLRKYHQQRTSDTIESLNAAFEQYKTKATKQ